MTAAITIAHAAPPAIQGPQDGSTSTADPSGAADDATHTAYMAALRVDEIFADQTYQRVLDVPRARQMAAGWDRRLAGVVEVSDRGPQASPRFAIIDGQHRWAAAQFLVDPPQLVANVHEGLSITGEAELFDRLNKQRRQITTFDHWRARRTAGDPLICGIEATVAGVGLRVSESSAAVGGIACVSTLEKIATSAGGLELLKGSLTILVAAWGVDQAVYEAPAVLGVGLLLDHFDDRLDAQVLIAALSECNPRRIRSDAATLRDTGMMSGSLSKLAAVALLNRYNAKAKAGRARLALPERWAGVLPKPAAGRWSKPAPPAAAMQVSERVSKPAPVTVPGAADAVAPVTVTMPVDSPPAVPADRDADKAVPAAWKVVASSAPAGPAPVPAAGPPMRDRDLAELIDVYGQAIWDRAGESNAALAADLGITERQVRRIRADLGLRAS